MNLTQFNFAHPVYLTALLLIPALWLYSRQFGAKAQARKLEAFADKELLPHLLKGYGAPSRAAGFLPLWSSVWALGILALAGPRWNYVEIPSYKAQKSLVIALDLSRTMDQTDVKPSRLARAKERIADLVNDNPDLKVGLVAFAGDAHMITPVTEDRNTINHLLPALQTDLVAVPGRDYAAALKLAASMLKGEGQKAIVVMSDGPFTERSVQGIPVRAMDFNHSSGEAVSVAQLYGLRSLGAAPGASEISGKDWEPRFYIFLIPALLLSLLFFRRVRLSGLAKPAAQATAAAFAALILLPRAHADSPVKDLFLNRAMQGQRALDAHDYKRAEAKLEDPYRKGVAQYRAGNYAAAASSFEKSQRPQVAADSRYNLGNALAEQGQFEPAIAAYKDALQKRPNFENARRNLKIVEDLLKKKQQEQKEKQAQSPPPPQPKKPGDQKKPGQPQQQAGNAQGQPKQASQKGAQPSPTQSAKPGAAQEQAAQPTPETAKAKPGAEQARAERPGPDDQKQAKTYARDVDADRWLNLVRNDPHTFLKNQFLIESARAQAQNKEQ